MTPNRVVVILPLNDVAGPARHAGPAAPPKLYEVDGPVVE
jgi:hypothetical protein